jgi:hypothetical protein
MTGDERQRGRVAQILRDVHFWVPVAVLLAGLLVLKLFQ